MNLENSTIIVTGATSGIGLALTRSLHAQGCRVVAVGRSHKKLERLCHDHDNIVPIHCNMASKGQVIAAAMRMAELSPCALINNAAVQFTPKFTDADFSFDGIEVEIDTNFTSVAWLTSLLLPSLLDNPKGASIVNITSGLAIHPKTSSAIYCATKAAVHSLSQSLRYQLEDTSVRVLEVLLPMVQTPMTDGRDGNKITPEHAAKEIIKAITHGRDELYVGKARLLPILTRLAPSATKRILKNA